MDFLQPQASDPDLRRGEPEVVAAHVAKTLQAAGVECVVVQSEEIRQGKTVRRAAVSSATSSSPTRSPGDRMPPRLTLRRPGPLDRLR